MNLELRNHHQNWSIMGIAQIKEDLHRQIEQADRGFLRILHAMTVAYNAEHQEVEISDGEIAAICKDGDYKPMTKAELLSEIDEANTAIENGNYVTIEELEKEMEQW